MAAGHGAAAAAVAHQRGVRPLQPRGVHQSGPRTAGLRGWRPGAAAVSPDGGGTRRRGGGACGGGGGGGAMMAIHRSFMLDISYSQVAVFDRSLARPFNFWTARHVSQAFAWRSGSVAFRTLAEGGLHRVTGTVPRAAIDMPAGAVRIIWVQFQLPSSGN